jgi:hypothetical protein
MPKTLIDQLTLRRAPWLPNLKNMAVLLSGSKLLLAYTATRWIQCVQYATLACATASSARAISTWPLSATSMARPLGPRPQTSPYVRRIGDKILNARVRHDC